MILRYKKDRGGGGGIGIGGCGGGGIRDPILGFWDGLGIIGFIFMLYSYCILHLPNIKLIEVY